ncbi:hypothetical protein Glove_144g147 [Diversispora epigaea]|uniref:Uncharacterized protein n=1 Tax=Diversispora epigaea TaxID=1348612 RepID=A0A397IU60_9GLOM|nr:hypothetical protein Glove_144g147 [Diversispora epigaea]
MPAKLFSGTLQSLGEIPDNQGYTAIIPDGIVGNNFVIGLLSKEIETSIEEFEIRKVACVFVACKCYIPNYLLLNQEVETNIERIQD